MDSLFQTIPKTFHQQEYILNHTHPNRQEMFAFMSHSNLDLTEVPFYQLALKAMLNIYSYIASLYTNSYITSL